MSSKPVVERAPDDEEERLLLYPLSFEEALQAALAVDPKKLHVDAVGEDEHS